MTRPNITEGMLLLEIESLNDYASKLKINKRFSLQKSGRYFVLASVKTYHSEPAWVIEHMADLKSVYDYTRGMADAFAIIADMQK